METRSRIVTLKLPIEALVYKSFKGLHAIKSGMKAFKSSTNYFTSTYLINFGTLFQVGGLYFGRERLATVSSLLGLSRENFPEARSFGGCLRLIALLIFLFFYLFTRLSFYLFFENLYSITIFYHCTNLASIDNNLCTGTCVSLKEASRAM